VLNLGTSTLALTPSPGDWRDQWIYFLMLDRFNNRLGPPNRRQFDDPLFSEFQGGTFRGVKAQLPSFKQLGAGAIWISLVAPSAVISHAAGTVQVQEVYGSTGTGPLNTIRVTLGPMEVQILAQ